MTKFYDVVIALATSFVVFSVGVGVVRGELPDLARAGGVFLLAAIGPLAALGAVWFMWLIVAIGAVALVATLRSNWPRPVRIVVLTGMFGGWLVLGTYAMSIVMGGYFA